MKLKSERETELFSGHKISTYLYLPNFRDGQEKIELIKPRFDCLRSVTLAVFIYPIDMALRGEGVCFYKFLMENLDAVFLNFRSLLFFISSTHYELKNLELKITLSCEKRITNQEYLFFREGFYEKGVDNSMRSLKYVVKENAETNSPEIFMKTSLREEVSHLSLEMMKWKV